MAANPYNVVPYRSAAIEWSAPERLALVSLLHGGPRVSVDAYRYLELGCGDGGNLLPLAYYRPHASFVGVDGAELAAGLAESRRAELGLENVQIVQADFESVSNEVVGPFDFIVAHGVFSWVPLAVRDRLLALASRHLRPGGLLYLNYNTKPGWTVRGMVREFLLAQTRDEGHLERRAELAQAVAAKMAASLAAAPDHPYAQLMEREFRFVCDSAAFYVAHEFLAPENHSYWRSEFSELASRNGFDYVADADFNRPSGRVPGDLAARIEAAGIRYAPDDTVDLLSYRQMHSPILTKGGFNKTPPSDAEMSNLYIASCLTPADGDAARPSGQFRHPSGYEVEAKTETISSALNRLRARWPRGERVGELFDDVRAVQDDLLLLFRYGMIELRIVEPDLSRTPVEPMVRASQRWGTEVVDAYHGSARTT